MSEKIHADDPLELAINSDGGENNPDVQYLLNSPAYMGAAMRRQLLQEMVKSLPVNVQKRINALKNIELDRLSLEAKFYEEVYQLERKYQDLYQPLHDKRKEIVAGSYEPTEKETEWTFEAASEDVSEEVQNITLELRKNLKLNYQDDVKGVPDFWLTIFRNTELLSSMLQLADEPVLKKLTDIKIVYAQDPMSYTLEFYFEPNEYFTNAVLTKQYFLKSEVDKEFPFTFEGPEIYKCVGCNIDWHKGKNLTVKTIKKKQKHKARGAVRTITKQIPADSFFNFFNPPQVQDENKVDVDYQAILSTDFEIGHFLRARIIPKAILYYTGDIVDEDDDEDDYDEEEEEEEEEEDDESEESENERPAARNRGGNKKKATAPAVNAAGNPAECQQQ